MVYVDVRRAYLPVNRISEKAYRRQIERLARYEINLGDFLHIRSCLPEVWDKYAILSWGEEGDGETLAAISHWASLEKRRQMLKLKKVRHSSY